MGKLRRLSPKMLAQRVSAKAQLNGSYISTKDAEAVIKAMPEVVVEALRSGEFDTAGIPGLCTAKHKVKPAVKAGPRRVFGEIKEHSGSPEKHIIRVVGDKKMRDALAS